MADLTITREMLKGRRGVSIMIEGGRPSEYSINTCLGYMPDRETDDDYPWCNASATVLDGDRQRAAYYAAERAKMPRLSWYATIEIEGMGTYALCPPNPPGSFFLDGDHPVLMPLTGGPACGQAAKRCRASALADAKRPIPQYDNT